MKKEDEKILNEMKTDRNWTQNTYYSYKQSLTNYTKIQKQNMTQLLKEAKKEKDLDWKETKLRKRLTKYLKYLYQNYNITTADMRFSRIQTIYGHFDIDMDKLPYISDKNARKTPPLRFKQLPTRKILKKAVDISPPLMSAIIFFMSSSGCARNETLKLTINDFIEATEDYHNENSIQDTIATLITQKEVVPTFEILRQKTNKYYNTFCSDEAVKGILNYLLTREDKLEVDTRLFKISVKHFDYSFRKINRILQLGKVGGRNRFTSHMLRKFHASHLAMSTEDSETGFKIPGMNINDIDALQGRGKGSTRNSYFFDDFDGIRKQYIQALPRLLINNTNKGPYRSKEYLELEKKMSDELNEKNKIISNISSENINLKKTNEILTERQIKNEERLTSVEDSVNSLMDVDDRISFLDFIKSRSKKEQ